MEGRSYQLTTRSTPRRHPERSSAERTLVHAILDEGLVAHVAVVVDGLPLVIPMSYGRRGDDLVLHGAPASRLMRTLAAGAEACVSVTLLDGIVLARSTFHSSMNYRSVVAFGHTRAIAGDDERRAALEILVEHILPGRARLARGPDAAELAATEVVAFRIREATVKVRSGPPVEPARDVAADVWAGVVPLALRAGRPEPAPNLRAGIEAPAHLRRYRRPSGRSPRP